MNKEDIEKYLPKYLSSSSINAMREALREFPKIDSSRYYTTKLVQSAIVYQGDGIKNLTIISLPDIQTKKKDCIVISNSCDIEENNTRLFSSRILYSPIIAMGDYERVLLDEGHTAAKVKDHLTSIKNQEITQIFFLPAIGQIIDDSIVFLDRILNLPTNFIDRKNLQTERVFTLSNFGHYLFLFKLSIHFSRIQEGIDRD